MRPPPPAHLLALILLLACGLTSVPRSNAQTPADTNRFLGTWKWETTTPNLDTFESTLKLSLENNDLKGVVTARGMESQVTDIEIQGDRIRFKVVRMRNNQKTFANYDGRLEGKLVKGKFEANFGGETRTRDWEALREADFAARPPNLNGNWRYSFPGHSGQSFEPILKLKHERDAITGTLQFNENSTPITEARLDGTNLWIKIVRDRDGKALTSIYKGGVSGANIQGTIETDWTGVPTVHKWEARRERRQ